jgi:hypothetical protein
VTLNLKVRDRDLDEALKGLIRLRICFYSSCLSVKFAAGARNPAGSGPGRRWPRQAAQSDWHRRIRVITGKLQTRNTPAPQTIQKPAGGRWRGPGVALKLCGAVTRGATGWALPKTTAGSWIFFKTLLVKGSCRNQDTQLRPCAFFGTTWLNIALKVIRGLDSIFQNGRQRAEVTDEVSEKSIQLFC